MKHVGILESNLSGSGFFGFKVCKDAGFDITFFTRNLPRYRNIEMGKMFIDKYVDEIIETETNDFENISKSVFDVHNKRPFDAFLTLSEYDIVSTARIASELGLPHIDANAAVRSRNKHLTRLSCQSNGVPAPKFVAIKSTSEMADALKVVRLPCIVKPADETSSTDVRKCYSLEEAVDHYNEIRSKSENVRGQKRYEYVLVEECINGYEVSVETLTLHGKHYVYGVTDKMLGGNRYFVEVGHAFPSSLPEKIVNQCAAVATASLDAVGFDMGAAHIEVKIDDEGPKLIEINGRPGGDRIPDLVNMVSGRDPVVDHVHAFLGMDVNELSSSSESGRGAAVSFFHTSPGTIAAVTGVEDIRYSTQIREVVLPDLIGKTVEPLTKSSTRLGYVIAEGSSAFHAWRHAETARSMLSIELVN